MRPLPKKARLAYPGYRLHGRVLEIRAETSIAGISCWVVRNPDTDGDLCLPKDRFRIMKEKS